MSYTYKFFTDDNVSTLTNVAFNYYTTDAVKQSYDEICNIESKMQEIDENFDIIEHLENKNDNYKFPIFQQTPILYLMQAYNDGYPELLTPGKEISQKAKEKLNKIDDGVIDTLKDEGLIEEVIESETFPKFTYELFEEYMVGPRPAQKNGGRHILIDMLFNRNAPLGHWEDNIHHLLEEVGQLPLDKTMTLRLNNIIENKGAIMHFIQIVQDMEEILYQIYNNKNNG